MRILVYRLGSLGDTVLALPCFHLIREKYPDSHVTVLTNAPVSGKAAPLESILAGTGLIDEVLHYPVGLRDPKQLAELRETLRAGKFDLAVSLAAARGWLASVRDFIFFKSCRISRVIGIPFSRRDLHCQHRQEEKLYESEAERLARRVSALGKVDLNDRKWFDLRLTAEERAEAEQLLSSHGIVGPFIVASLGTKTPLNDWGMPNWREFLRQLRAAHPGLGLVLLGSADEAARCNELQAAWKDPSANLCGKTTPRLSAAVLERAKLFVGHDSGPMHLAAAAGAPCVAIFSARCEPGKWFPVGTGNAPLYPIEFWDERRSDDLSYQQQALASITPAQVVAAAESLLHGAPPKLATN